MYKYILIIAIIIIPTLASAKKLDSLSVAKHKELYMDWDNDVFVFTDQYYSQGLHLYWVNPILKKNPLNHILLRLRNADNYFGLGIIQEMYTPKDIVDTLLNNIDRPYAGTLFLRSFIVSAVPDKRLKLTSQLDFGFLGPLSGAKQAQQIIHDWTGSSAPGGWDFQIDNRPYINYNLLIENGIISTQFFELNVNSRIRAGNIHDDIRVGTSLRTGKINNYFKGLNLSNKTYYEQGAFQFFVFGGLNMNIIAYNATFMGGIIPPESVHQFKFRDIENFVVDIHGGVHLSYKSFGMKAQLTWKSLEFEGGEDHGWGTISLYLRL